MPVTAHYDAIADWYADYTAPDGAAADFGDRVHGLLGELLGAADTPGTVVLDVGCGTGARVPALAALGWRPAGVDLSAGQLRHAARRLPVAQADAAALPIGTGTVAAAVGVLCHTDLPDHAGVVREIARVLRPGGAFIHIGVHPCFTGAFADRTDSARIIVDNGYLRTERRFDSYTPHGVRARVGAWHVTLAGLLAAPLAAGLTITRVAESGLDGDVPDLFGYRAVAAG